MNYENLKHHIKSHIGPGKKYDAIAKETPQKKHTQSNTYDLMSHSKKGSGTYRKIIGRTNTKIDIHNTDKWKKKLRTNNISELQVKRSMINMHSPYLDSANADHLSRLKLGKTLFKNQLHTIGITDDNFCDTCTREFNESVTEDYRHAMFDCPTVQTIINSIKSTFFEHTSSKFTIADILLSVEHSQHNNLKEIGGIETASLIWDLFQAYILKCHSSGTTPVSYAAIHEIKSQLNRILKILPNSKFATRYKSSLELQHDWALSTTI